MEKSVVTTCLIGCLTLGFLSLFSVYLPGRLSEAKGPLTVSPMPLQNSPSLSEIVEEIPASAGAAIEEMNANPSDDDFGEENNGMIASEDLALPVRARGVRGEGAPKGRVVPHDMIAKNYPLKMYEPLSEAMPRHYGHGLTLTNNLKPAFEFWRNVYANYDSSKTILHDSEHLDIVYGVLNFSNLDEAVRKAIEEKKREELSEMLLRFDQGEEPKTAGEHIVYGLFNDIHDSRKFRNGAESIRSQWGQKDRFTAGLGRAGRYMPMMEEIFIREGVPKEIAKLTFVESMFQLGAISKAGATGPFQFMPATARHYMTVNRIVDERLDPLMAAQGAARLLKKNYELVESWPLAINGYNTGILRMVKAVRQLGTKDIGTIIERFEDSGYQFASRNFYPEFLAALEVADHYKEYFAELKPDIPLPFDEVILPYDSSLNRLAEATGTDVNVLKDLNPAYDESLFDPHATTPKGYTIRVPRGQRMVYLAALDQMEAQEQLAKRPVAKIPGTPTRVVLDAH